MRFRALMLPRARKGLFGQARGHRQSTLLIVLMVTALLPACASVPRLQATYDARSLRFSGERALEIEAEFVTQFPNRSSGMPNNRLAVEWLRRDLTRLGLTCRIDEWDIVNYSRPVNLNNIICELPGKDTRQILLVAHHDQSPDTVQGADDDGCGIAVLVHLAEIFAAEGRPPYTLVFLGTDAEEYGMIGMRRYLETHSRPGRIIAGISLDNLGMRFYDGIGMDVRGQFRGYGQLWLQRTAQEAARAAGDLWVPRIAGPVDQVLGQAVPISFLDAGPVVAAGIPAIGFHGHVPPEHAEDYWQSYHTPNDTLEHQSANTLYHSGRITEALIRQLLSMESFPSDPGPFLYFEGSGQVLRGLPLWLLFLGFVALFFLGSALVGERSLTANLRGWAAAAPHVLSLWLPLVAASLLLYLFVAVGLMETYHLYPATSKDEPLFQPRWPAVILFVLALAVFFFMGRRLLSHASRELPAHDQIKSLSLLIMGVAGVPIALRNPFSLLFMLPLVFWFAIRGRRGVARALDVLLFALGGLVVYVLLYFFGFTILRNGLNILWYLMMMLSIGTISFPATLVITAIVAAGLAMVVSPPGGGHRGKTASAGVR